LDLWACDALEQALLDFDGTAIVVSHDRYFLNRVVDLLLVFEDDGRQSIIHGNYDMYERMRLHQEPIATEKKEAVTEEPRASNKPTKRKRKFPYRKLDDLEAEIMVQEMLVKDLEAKLASPDLYREGAKVQEITQAFEGAKV